MSTLTQVSDCVVSAVVSVCGPHPSRSTLCSAAEARVTTSSHLHNHALADADTQAIVVQQELSAALVQSIQQWAQCGLATTAIRQLVQLDLGVPFLTSDTKKKVWVLPHGPARHFCSSAADMYVNIRLLSWERQVSNLMQKAASAKVDPLDAHKFIQSVAEQQGAFLEYKLDAQGCLEAVVWALPEQVEAMQLYGDVWIQDNTCKTLSANRPFFAIVGVDGNSRYCLFASSFALAPAHFTQTELPSV
jgi:hypothetical protein